MMRMPNSSKISLGQHAGEEADSFFSKTAPKNTQYTQKPPTHFATLRGHSFVSRSIAGRFFPENLHKPYQHLSNLNIPVFFRETLNKSQQKSTNLNIPTEGLAPPWSFAKLVCSATMAVTLSFFKKPVTKSHRKSQKVTGTCSSFKPMPPLVVFKMRTAAENAQFDTTRYRTPWQPAHQGSFFSR